MEVKIHQQVKDKFSDIILSCLLDFLDALPKIEEAEDLEAFVKDWVEKNVNPISTEELEKENERTE